MVGATYVLLSALCIVIHMTMKPVNYLPEDEAARYSSALRFQVSSQAPTAPQLFLSMTSYSSLSHPRDFKNTTRGEPPSIQSQHPPASRQGLSLPHIMPTPLPSISFPSFQTHNISHKYTTTLPTSRPTPQWSRGILCTTSVEEQNLVFSRTASSPPCCFALP